MPIRILCTRTWIILLAATVLNACSRPAEPPADVSEPATPVTRSVEAIADEYLEAWFSRYPTWPTYLGLRDRPHDRLFDNSLTALAAWQAREDQWLAELDAIGKPGDVGSRDWTTYGVLHEELASSIAQRICRKELWETSTTTAWYVSLPFVFDEQLVDTPALRQQALTRLGELDSYIDTEIANLRRGLELGYSSPRVTVAAVPQQVRELREGDSPFLNMARRAQDQTFAEAVRQILDDEVSPAIGRYASFIENEYLPRAREDIAIRANTDGAACYPALVRAYSSLTPSPDEIHALGLAQIARLRAAMSALLDEHYDGMPLDDFIRRIRSAGEYTFRSEDEVLQYSVDALERAKQAMPRAFGSLPKAQVSIKPYPAYASSGIGSYQASSEDGSRPGIYYVAVSNPETRSRVDQQSTIFHETYPGHHLQGSIALELGDRVHPLARYLGNAGYGEGWAMYAERIAQELNLYSGASDLLGMYLSQSARAARLVVDTGLHTRGWTRQQAVDYMLESSSWAPVDIENDVDRYISWPGQANAYMLGLLEVERLRARAETELGEAFDLRAFHDRVLENGNITLPMLAEVIEDWIRGQ